MKKIIKFQTISLGSEPATIPDTDAIKKWIQDRHHKGGDILLFHLFHMISAQKSAAIDLLCAGGVFYRDRITGCLKGLEDGRISGELGIDPAPVVSDMEELVRAGYQFRLGIPAPHEYVSADSYYGDAGEALTAMIGQFRRLLREMRDAGVSGHVFIYNKPVVEEFEAFSGKKVLFFTQVPEREDLEMLLEYQDTIVTPPAGLDLVIDITGEYHVKKLVLLDPAEETISRALRHWDPEQIAVGGYCREHHPGYWNTISSVSSYTNKTSE